MRFFRQALRELIEAGSSTLDLTNESHLDQVRDAAETVLRTYSAGDDLAKLERDLADRKDEVPLMVHLAVKLTLSKQIVSAIDEKVGVSVVFAMYKEHNRILHKNDHEHGEDFLNRKVAQLNWLFADHPNFDWELIVVDDGCPEGSGRIAREMIDRHDLGDRVKVLFLEEAIQQDHPVTQPMSSASESQKGGSIQYGMWTAAERNRSNHIIVFTDADLSTHLGQTGLLVDGILNQGKDAAIGSRRETTSIVVKKGVRNTRGKLFIYLWKRIITKLNYVVDTQCGFKAFRADVVRAILNDLLEKKFAFDIELLLKTELKRADSIAKVPIAWIDSEAASTTTDIGPYLSMLKAMVKMYRKYLPESAESNDFAQLIESLTEDSWQRLVDNIPAEIADGEPADFGDYNEVKAGQLRSAIT